MREFLPVLLYQVGQLPKKASAFGGDHSAPSDTLQRATCSCHRLVYVVSSGQVRSTNVGSCRRICKKLNSTIAFDPLAADQHWPDFLQIFPNFALYQHCAFFLDEQVIVVHYG